MTKAEDNFDIKKQEFNKQLDSYQLNPDENTILLYNAIINLLNSANNNEATKKKVSEVIVKIVENNPEKAVEIIENNKNTNTVTETIKTKIENNEAVTTEDFKNVFETNVSPN